MTNKLEIQSLQGNYEVVFLEALTELTGSFEIDDHYVLIDEQVMHLYSDRLISLIERPTFSIKADENSKTLSIVEDFSAWLIEQGASKSSTILAIGGGVIQDVATFTAHVFKRGISWEYIPTTLLSQSDSCIGAKCGINVNKVKNQIGVMHSPKRVWIVSEFLRTLDEETFLSGYGEILKLSLTPPQDFYSEFKRSLQENGFSRENSLDLLRMSLGAKRAIIEVDEYERDLRRILNYGHTFGHALEAITNNEVNHGFGVIFGIDLINYLSNRWGYLDTETYMEIRNTIKTHFPTNFVPKSITALQLIEGIKSDKKVAHGKINFAILNSEKQLVILPKLIDHTLLQEVESYMNDETIFTTS